MAIFDTENRRVVVRVVYDGPMMAGKTTNLRQIEGFFTRLRRSDVVVPSELGGRTVYFDWMHLDSGLVGGNPLRCQLVTVPGQRVLAGRRDHILAGADAVVFVCESTRRGLDTARVMAERLFRRFEDAAGGPPIVIQANKQDLADALSPEEVREGIGAVRSVPVVAARALEGVGVRESLVLAIRFAAAAAHRELLGAGPSSLAGAVEGPDELLRELRSIDAGWAGPDVERSAQAASATVASSEPRRGPGSPAPDPPAATDRPLSPAGDVPPLPGHNLPAGHVWPPARGREVLSTISPDHCELRQDLIGKQGIEEGSGTSDVVIVQAGDRCLKTSPRRSFGDADEARDLLLELIRRKRALGRLLLPDTVLALASTAEPRTSFWLWTVTPWVPTLRSCLATAVEKGDLAGITTGLTAFAEATAWTLRLCARKELVLDLHPSNFGFGTDGLCYLDDDIGKGQQVPSVAHALLQRVEEYSRFPGAIEIYLTAAVEHIREQVTREELTTTGFEASLAATPARSTLAREAKERLHALLRRKRS